MMNLLFRMLKLDVEKMAEWLKLNMEGSYTHKRGNVNDSVATNNLKDNAPTGDSNRHQYSTLFHRARYNALHTIPKELVGWIQHASSKVIDS